MSTECWKTVWSHLTKNRLETVKQSAVIRFHLHTQLKLSCLERCGSTSQRAPIKQELASLPFLRTMSITLRALSTRVPVLADSISPSFITPNSRSLSRSWSRLGSDTLLTNYSRTFLSLSSAGMMSSAGWFLCWESVPCWEILLLGWFPLLGDSSAVLLFPTVAVCPAGRVLCGFPLLGPGREPETVV